jgi:hypothetical protein
MRQGRKAGVSDTKATKGDVVGAINKDLEAWEALLAEVGEDRMLEPGPMGQWTFKDLVAHLTSWRERSLQRLEAAAHGQPAPPPPWPAELDDDDAINDWFQQQSEAKLLGEVLEESRTSYARLTEVVQQLPDEAVTDPAYFPWLEGTSLADAIISGEFFSHLRDEHMDDIRQWLSTRAPEPAGRAQVEL